MFGLNRLRKINFTLSFFAVLPGRLKNKAGNIAITSVLVTTAVISGIYFVANKIATERKLTLALKKNIVANLALRSVTDYVKYGIRKSWCFDENMLPELPEVCVGSFTQERSTFRLLMPLSYEESLRNLAQQVPSPLPPLPSGDLHLSTITIKTEIEKISPQHPLAQILRSLRSSPIKYVRIKLNRIEDQTLPATGDEVFVETIVEFLDSSSDVLRDGSELYREVSRFVSNPREVNTFALMVAGNMYLGTTDAPPTNAGNFFIPSRKDNSLKTGLVFDSAVYVNGNIQMNEKVYTPVSFNDTVVLGNGQILSNKGQPFLIGEPLGIRKYWSDLKSFGGFSKGFESDSKRDSGLDTLAGITPSVAVNNDLIQQCISLIRAASNLQLTQDAILSGRKLDEATDLNFTNRYSFSKSPGNAQDIFVPQTITNSQLPTNISSDGHIWYNPSMIDLETNRLIFWADLSWNGQKLRVPLLENTEGSGIPLAVNFSPYSLDEVTGAQQDYTIAEKNYLTAKAAYDKILSVEPNKFKTASSDFKDDGSPDSSKNEDSKPDQSIKINNSESAPSNPPSAVIALPKSPAPQVIVNIEPTSERHDWDDKRQNLADAMTKALAVSEELKNDWQKKKDYYDNPAAVNLTTLKPTIFGKKQSPFREVTVTLINNTRFVLPKSDFRNGPYTLQAPDFLSLEAMDYSAHNGASTRKNASQTLFNVVFHTFEKNANGIIVHNTLFQKDLKTPIAVQGADESFDYETMTEGCYSGTNAGGGVNLDAFKPAGWTTSFTTGSEDSWNFASPDDLTKGVYIDQVFSSDSAVFDVGAIRKVCTIKASAKFVSGFYVCQQLVIESRTDPLTIVGTFIVSRDLKIHPAALTAGIRWSNIHNQRAISKLKSIGLLSRLDGSKCNALPKPFWHPDPGLVTLADRLRCSSEFLLQGKNPPRWTSVDPDCGRLKPTDTTTQCMKRIRNFNFIQLERVYGR